MATLAERCSQAREECGLSQAEAARRIGIRQPSLSDIETGKTQRLKSATAIRMARVYGVEPAWLVEERLPKRKGEVVHIPPGQDRALLGDDRRHRINKLTRILDKQDVVFWAEIDALLSRWEIALDARSRSKRPGPKVPRRKGPGKQAGGRPASPGS